MRVIIESPFAAASLEEAERNLLYARRALRDSLKRGESPLALHLLYPQVLDDSIPEEREIGMMASRVWYNHADIVAVYNDFGVSHGMAAGIAIAIQRGIEIDIRSIINDKT